jgi:DNA-binding NarL/FixJ family response regulator
MLLSGMSRKAIAKQLGISEDTVGNHIKALFDHYGVESAIELAAIFLQSH